MIDRALDEPRLQRAIGELSVERISDEVIDEPLAGAKTKEEIVARGRLLPQVTERRIEGRRRAELTEHLGHERHAEPPAGAATRATARPEDADHRSAVGTEPDHATATAASS